MANEQTIFQDLQVQAFRKGIAPRTKEAQNWFKRQVQKMGTLNRQQLIKNSELSPVDSPKPGEMYMYFYDPKYKDTLPYYDRFPLIVMVDIAPGGFYGLNLHYLPPTIRARFFDTLMHTMNNQKYDETTRLKVTYQMLKSVSKMSYFRACYKHYLTNHVTSNIVKVNPTEWPIALFLPTQHFTKASDSRVWKDSKGKY